MLQNKRLRALGFEEKQFQIGDVVLNHLRGPANGPPLILLPGQTQPWQSYSKVLALLRHDFEIIAFDIHGHGQSSFVPQCYNYQDIGEDLVAFMRSELDQAAFISGNSSGGVIAVWLAANAPEQVPCSRSWPAMLNGCKNGIRISAKSICR